MNHLKELNSTKNGNGILFPRKRLLGSLKRKASKRVFYFCAKAGYGKTTSVSLWLTAAKMRSTWLPLARYDNESYRFCQRLLGALSKWQPEESGFGRYTEEIKKASCPMEYLLEKLQYLDGNVEMTLVMDDLHNIVNVDILGSLALIIDRLPESYKVVIISRCMPEEMLFQLDTIAKVVFITEKELSFKQEEVLEILEAEGMAQCEQKAKSIMKDTGGWPIGVCACLMTDSAENFERLGGTGPGFLQRYINMQVWPGWDEKTQRFLLDCSVCPELYPDICNRLTNGSEGAEMLEKIKAQGAFLSEMENGRVRFHEIFRSFLQEKLRESYDNRKIESLYTIVADWCMENENYVAAFDYYLKGGNMEGVERILRIQSTPEGETGVELILNYAKALVIDRLPDEVIEKSLPLLSLCMHAMYLDGDNVGMARYAEKMKALLKSDVPAEVLENALMIGSMDYSESICDYSGRIESEFAGYFESVSVEEHTRRINTITQNLPYVHHSMRDFSELCTQKKIDFNKVRSLRRTIGKMVGEGYPALENAIISGIYYERGELQEALGYAIEAYECCDEDQSPEISFSVDAILVRILDALGKPRCTIGVYMDMEKIINDNNALYLKPSLRSIRYEWRLRNDDKSAAEDYLKHHSTDLGGHLQFYKMYRHFTTLRAYLCVGDNRKAAVFAKKLIDLCKAYKRPLEIIEANVLYSIALWRGKSKQKAVLVLEKAVEIAQKHGYVMRFLIEAGHIDPIMKELLNKLHNASRRRHITPFAERLYDEICKARPRGIQGYVEVALTKRQLSLLTYLQSGMSEEKIAEKLEISKNTVNLHIKRMLNKMNAGNVQEAIKIARKTGIM